MITLPKRSQADTEAHINIVPYIDVMLVLLVIFMITTPIIEQGVEVDLPNVDAKSINISNQQPAIISINKDGRYSINSMDGTDAGLDSIEHLPLRTIIARVQGRMEVFPKMKVFVKGDNEVPYGAVVALMFFLQKNGVEKVGLVTESE